MTDKIPPRPTHGTDEITMRSITSLQSAFIDHEHAVAKVAVEAINEKLKHNGGCDCWMNLDGEMIEGILCEAKRQIEESGWQP